jgi:hypothetical protein
LLGAGATEPPVPVGADGNGAAPPGLTEIAGLRPGPRRSK